MSRTYKCSNQECKQLNVEITVPAKKVKGLENEGGASLVKRLQWEHSEPLYVTYPETVYCGYCGLRAADAK